jgi:hypothetical protein
MTADRHGWIGPRWCGPGLAFSIFRLYGPLEPFYEKTWVLPDIEKH